MSVMLPTKFELVVTLANAHGIEVSPNALAPADKGIE
jgi:hypothetical protein